MTENRIEAVIGIPASGNVVADAASVVACQGVKNNGHVEYHIKVIVKGETERYSPTGTLAFTRTTNLIPDSASDQKQS